MIKGFNGVWSSVLMLVFWGALLCGNFYCGWLCPFGAFQEWVSRIGSLLFLKKVKISKEFGQYLILLKYFLYLLILTSELLDLVVGFTATSSFNGNYHFLNVIDNFGVNMIEMLWASDAMVLIFLVAYTLMSLFLERPFCNYLCPDGVKYNLLGLARFFSVKRNKDVCINCKKCNQICPMNIDIANTKKLRSANCINCMECLRICPVRNALRYEF